ncbi:Mce-associated membrane protein [Nocardioides sp. J9]|uniref:hypothetical protein n=1 Tax=unclassified Nocardioides TaxID=2615069 RepID=UPI000490BBB2|nr:MULTISPECIES: hypothetical protein [unclassified Nocardioides]TWG91557.1 Mce-associated membrane protein [Nocardioides sp. J9]
MSAVRGWITGASRRSLVLLAATLVLLGLSVERGLAWSDERQRASDAEEVVAAASAEVAGLVDISSSTSEADLDALLDGATAGFRTELEAQAEQLRKALVDNKVTATGEVVSAGVVELGEDRATVIVAAAGSVRNKSTKKAEPRNYRLRVELSEVDEKWLVSGLEFVS